MTLPREQIDVLLERMDAEARRRHRENPGDAALAQDLVAEARALLRTVALEHHLHICDHVQHLLLTLDGDDLPAAPAGEPPVPALQHAVSAQGGVTPLGIALVDDPFDLDAYDLGACDGDEPGMDAFGDACAAACDESCDPAGTAAQPEPAAATAMDRERRRSARPTDLRDGLTPKQLATLDTMAQFGWTLEFVRRPMFMPPQPVAFDRNGQRFVVVDADGQAQEDPSVRIRA